MISEGKAHIDGFEIELPHSLRVRFPVDPDIKTIESEPHSFQADDKGNMKLTLNEKPVSKVSRTDITLEKTTTLTHGAYLGAIDPIPDVAVLEIMQVKQSGIIFKNGADYKLEAGKVDWSLPGAAPAPSSSYQITYRYRSKITPKDISELGFTISGAVKDTLVLVDYTWMMPRYDLITIDSKGTVRRITGYSSPMATIDTKLHHLGNLRSAMYINMAQKRKTKCNQYCYPCNSDK